MYGIVTYVEIVKKIIFCLVAIVLKTITSIFVSDEDNFSVCMTRVRRR